MVCPDDLAQPLMYFSTKQAENSMTARGCKQVNG